MLFNQDPDCKTCSDPEPQNTLRRYRSKCIVTFFNFEKIIIFVLNIIQVNYKIPPFSTVFLILRSLYDVPRYSLKGFRDRDLVTPLENLLFPLCCHKLYDLIPTPSHSYVTRDFTISPFCGHSVKWSMPGTLIH